MTVAGVINRKSIAGAYTAIGFMLEPGCLFIREDEALFRVLLPSFFPYPP